MTDTTALEARVQELEAGVADVSRRSTALIEERRRVAQERSGIRARRHVVQAGLDSARIAAESLRSGIEHGMSLFDQEGAIAQSAAIEDERTALSAQLDEIDVHDAFLWSQAQGVQDAHRELLREEARIESELLVARSSLGIARVVALIPTPTPLFLAPLVPADGEAATPREGFVDLFEDEGFVDEDAIPADSGALTLEP